jgi:hypothetical protein
MTKLHKGQKFLTPIRTSTITPIEGYRRVQVVGPQTETQEGLEAVWGISYDKQSNVWFKTWHFLHDLLPGEGPITDMPVFGDWIPEESL